MLNARSQSIDEIYSEALDSYILDEIVLAGKDAIPVLDQFKKRKCDANNLPIGDVNHLESICISSRPNKIILIYLISFSVVVTWIHS